MLLEIMFGGDAIPLSGRVWLIEKGRNSIARSDEGFGIVPVDH